MRKRTVNKLLIGALYLAIAVPIAWNGIRTMCREYKISQSPTKREIPLQEGRTNSLIGTMDRGAVFDTNGDGEPDMIIETGSCPSGLRTGYRTSRVLRSTDKGFQERLKSYPE